MSDDEFDIVAAGFDAGVRLGDVIEKDMIAVPLTGQQREVVVASPTYLAAHSAPRHPRELIRHRCIGWRPSPDVAPYLWEFEEAGIPFDVAVNRISPPTISVSCSGSRLREEELPLQPMKHSGHLLKKDSLFHYWMIFFRLFLGFICTSRNVEIWPPSCRALIEHVRQWGKTSLQ